MSSVKKIFIWVSLLLFLSTASIVVYGGTLTNSYLARSPVAVSRAPAKGIIYKYNLYLTNDGTEYKTGDGYYINIYDKNTNNVNTYFNVSTAPTYVTDHWE